MREEFPMRTLLLTFFAVTLLLPFSAASRAEDAAGKTGIQISFVPPPLENASYSLGIYEAKGGKLVRRLREVALENAFSAGLNGLITHWDGKDDASKAVPPGRYAARGYAVGSMKVEGVEFLGNDWFNEDQSLRLKHIEGIALVPEDDGLAVVATLADDTPLLLRFSGKDGSLLWKQTLAPRVKSDPVPTEAGASPLEKAGLPTQVYVDEQYITVVRSQELAELYKVADGQKGEQIGRVTAPESKKDFFLQAVAHKQWSAGKDGSRWFAEPDTLYQLANKSGANASPGPTNPADFESAVRVLARKADAPRFHTVSASSVHDRLYLLEDTLSWQRVRGLSWAETKEENGKKISNWETFFERNIHRTDEAHGLIDPAISIPPPRPVKFTLVSNPLNPARSTAIELAASFDESGSYLTTADGLRLRQISKQPDLHRVRLTKGQKTGELTLFQSDAAVWEEFSITGANEMMEVDAGEIEMTANGEKPVETKAVEPPDL